MRHLCSSFETSMLENICQLVGNRRSRPEGVAALPARGKAVKRVSSWQEYLARHRSGATVPELAVRWAALSALERSAYAPEAEEAPPAVDAAVGPAEPTMPWPFTADGFNPISLGSLLDVSGKVKSLSRDWRVRVGRDVIRPTVRIDIEPSYTCGEIWGAGRCKEDMTENMIEELLRFKARFCIWAAMNKQVDARFDGMWKPLALFFFGRDRAAPAGAYDDVRGQALLLMFADGKKRQHFSLPLAATHRKQAMSSSLPSCLLIPSGTRMWHPGQKHDSTN